jgi:hypothetical protein
MTYFQKSGNKYHAKTQVYNNVSYHSKFEAAYAEALDLRVRGKDIKSWERQVKIPLKVNGMVIANYYIDFVVTHNDGHKEWVECKGFETEVWKMKWKLLEAIFDEIREGPDDCLTVVKQSSWGGVRGWR